MNLYLIDDVDIIAAENEKEAIDFYLTVREDNITPDDSEIELMTEDQLNNWVYYYFPGTEEEGATTTFKKRLEELIKENTKFPMFFATTEY